jgi:hypothetical protein
LGEAFPRQIPTLWQGEAFGHTYQGVDRRIVAQMLRPYKNLGNQLYGCFA